MLQYRRIGVTVKSGLDAKEAAVESILAILRSLGAEVFVDVERTQDIPGAQSCASFAEGQIDLLLVIGGDGTILRTVRQMSDLSVPILSVNRGTVGFLAETHLEEAPRLLPVLLSGGGVLEKRRMLRVRALRDGKELLAGHVLNEAVIAQGTIARLVDLETTVNGEPLTSFHADGLIIATPTGSTAYSLAAGGPIVHPTLDATILTPINPHSFSQKPIVIPGASPVEVTVQTKENKFQDTEVVLTLDGQTYVHLRRGDTVQTCGCDKAIQFLRRSEDTFFSTLRDKLKWGERVEG